jgi:hypothetical protein
LLRKLKRKISGKAIRVSSHRLVQRRSGHAIESGQVFIQHDALASNNPYGLFDRRSQSAVGNFFRHAPSLHLCNLTATGVPCRTQLPHDRFPRYGPPAKVSD